MTRVDDTEGPLVPRTNPDVGRPAVATLAPPQPTAAPIASKTRIPGRELVLEAGRHDASVGVEYRYWVGVSPSCPVQSITVAGIDFPKVNELLIDDPARTGQKRRVPVIGAIVFLDADRIRRLREQLPRTVIRFLDDGGEKEEPGTGQNIGDAHRQPRKGHVITVPSPEEVAQRRKDGTAINLYVPSRHDVPAARFMFAQICADQERGSRGEFYPDPLEVSGLDWPDELGDLDKLLS
ncbi:MAG TPA: hypothetical protein VNM34_15100 [Verrucomicrobiae bacterium]|nr:hypothetical protein [Verrucomicrobiae bacterium]